MNSPLYVLFCTAWKAETVAGTLAAIMIYELTMRIDANTKNKGKEIKGILSRDDYTSL